MKNTLLALTSLALGSTAFAGTNDYVSSNTQQQMTSSPLYQWFAGGSVGHLDDADETFYTVHFGGRFAGSGPVTHSWYAEVGYTNLDVLFADVDIVPVTLNYKFDYYFTDRFSFYAGVGAGAAFINADTFFGDDDDVSFTAQAVAGLAYDFTPSFQIYGGARFIWIDDATIFGASIDADDDIGGEIGLRFRF
jgi:opacity protein-like surface antigen